MIKLIKFILILLIQTAFLLNCSIEQLGREGKCMAKKEAYHITLIPGDGIGPEVTSAARKVIAAAGVVVDWEIVEAGAGAIEKYQTTLPEETLDSIKKIKLL